MNFLNEIVSDYPTAISFGPGRPMEMLFGVQDSIGNLSTFVNHWAKQTGMSVDEAWDDLGQYNRTNGIINDLVAIHLKQDEHIDVSPDSIVITVGAQEAMAIVLIGLLEPSRDLLLTSDPTYIGITGLARLLGISVSPVATSDDGLDPAVVEQAIITAGAKRVKALYDIPDFNNPLGTRLPYLRRLQLLEVCHRHGVLLIEDNAYGMFSYEGGRLPTLKALDQNQTVLYIGSLSKTLFPGLRLGYLVADQAASATGNTLAVELSKVKSLLTVNSSPLCQAIAGSLLLRSGISLNRAVQAKREWCHANRDVLLTSLAEEFAEFNDRVSWNQPQGGFFVTLTLPFQFDIDTARRCAANYGVIVCPMRFFCCGDNRNCQVRLAFSYVQVDDIGRGIKRLASFVRDEMQHS